MHPAFYLAFDDELSRSSKLAALLGKLAVAPPLLPGMKGPNPVIRAALGASRAAPAAAAGASKLPGGLVTGRSIAGAAPAAGGAPQIRMQSLL